MSHFSVIVFADRTDDWTRESVNKQVEELLAPYNEEVPYPPRQERCWCVGYEAKVGIRNAVDNEFGPIGIARDGYWNHPDVKAWQADGAKDDSPLKPAVDALNDRIFGVRERRHDELLAAHPGKDTPVVDCDECKGTGLSWTTRNPVGYWDWFQIGGRWTGMLAGYDPATDPVNVETCFVCGGTGMRNDGLGLQMRADDPSYACNGCDGKGKVVKWPTSWAKFDGDICGTSYVKFDDETRPYAIVTADGMWSGKGTMGWFGCSYDEKVGEAWKAEADRLLSEAIERRCLAVVVDCHT